jgi:nucleotide-binding universal stress UspA family protein
MYKKILAPLDGSDLAECTLQHVREIASSCGTAEVVLLTVMDLNLPQTDSWGLPMAEAIASAEHEKKRQRIIRPVLDYLTRQSSKLKEAGLNVKTELLEEGPDQKTAEVILLYARDNDIDLIIISSHGRSGISRWAFGSVADKVVTHSTVPVLTVVPKGCRIA